MANRKRRQSLVLRSCARARPHARAPTDPRKGVARRQPEPRRLSRSRPVKSISQNRMQKANGERFFFFFFLLLRTYIRI